MVNFNYRLQIPNKILLFDLSFPDNLKPRLDNWHSQRQDIDLFIRCLLTSPSYLLAKKPGDHFTEFIQREGEKKHTAVSLNHVSSLTMAIPHCPLYFPCSAY